MPNRELNNVKINVEFQETANRQQLSSGDEIKTLFGKIKKWFSDLKTVAFTGSYNDLLDKPTSMPASDVYEWAKQSTKPSYTKSDVGLSNVGNFKAVSTSANQGLSTTEKNAALGNLGIGRATSSYPKTTGLNTVLGSSLEYARADHVHKDMNADEHIIDYGSFNGPSENTNTDADNNTNWWLKAATFNHQKNSLYPFRFTLYVMTDDDKYNTGIRITGYLCSNVVQIDSVDNYGIDPALFNVMVYHKENTSMYTDTVYVWMDSYASVGGCILLDLYCKDVPSITWSLASYEDSVETDSTILTYLNNHVANEGIPSFYGTVYSKSIAVNSLLPFRYYDSENVDIGSSSTSASAGKSARFNDIYLKSSPNVSSDRNVKHNINKISDAFIDFFYRLIPVSFQFIDGTSGRTHIGFISQDVEEAMEASGLTSLDFAGFCKDKLTKSVKERVPETDENGNPIYTESGKQGFKAINTEVDILDENGDPKYFYSLRYEEFIALNTAAIQLQKTRIDNLESRIIALEGR